MGRYVRRGSTGIALIDATGYKPRLKYVFDVSDTGGKENARRVNLWELKDAHTDSVSAMLERNYSVSGKNGLAEQFESVASQLAAEYWRDHSRDILGIVADALIGKDEDRSQSLRRPSVRSKLQQASAEQKQPAAKKKDLEL